MTFDTVLAISPHTDDAEIGAGGLIRKLVEEGSRVYSVICTTMGERKAEVTNAAKYLGFKECRSLPFKIRTLPEHRGAILQKLIEFGDKLKPDLVLIPGQTDTHQDHRVVSEEAFRAFKTTTLWGYEIPWNCEVFPAQCFVEISEGQLSRKIRAVKCYEPSQSQRTRDRGKRVYDISEYFRAMAVANGVQIEKFKFAERFQVIRQCV